MPLTMRPTGLASPAYAARATAKEAATTATTSSSQFVPISLPALPDPNIGLRLTNIKPDMATANFFGLAANPRNVNHISKCPFLDRVNLHKICNQTWRRSVEMRRVYRRDAELFSCSTAPRLLGCCRREKRETNTNCRP